MTAQAPRMSDEESWEAYKAQLQRTGVTLKFSYEEFCQKRRESEASLYAATHPSKGKKLKWFLSDIGSLITNLGMYSSDPTLARQAMVYNVEQQVGVQRQIAADQRAEDQARDEERMRMFAREMAREMVAEVERQRKLT